MCKYRIYLHLSTNKNCIQSIQKKHGKNFKKIISEYKEVEIIEYHLKKDQVHTLVNI